MPHKDPEARRAYQREYQKRWGRENRNKRLRYERAWVDRNRDKVREVRRQWRARNPEKIRAQNTLRRAIYAGKIERGPCEVCGKPNADAHHGDYSKPFEVRWLCRRHHMELHRPD